MVYIVDVRSIVTTKTLVINNLITVNKHGLLEWWNIKLAKAQQQSTQLYVTHITIVFIMTHDTSSAQCKFKIYNIEEITLSYTS